MTRRLLAAYVAELRASAQAAYGTAVTCAGLLLGLWLVWFTPVGPLLAGVL